MSQIKWLKVNEKKEVVYTEPTSNVIAVFDSGMGGMSAVEYLLKVYPEKTFMFLKDSDNFPYGPKTREELIKIGQGCVDDLTVYNPPMIVIACNTMCCALTEPKTELPIVRINELIAEQVKQTLPAGKKIFIICTQSTKDSGFYQNALKDYEVEVRAAPEFVTMVEHDEITKEKVAKVLFEKERKYDGIILGCTHFNYLHDICAELLGDEVHIFDGLENLVRKINKLEGK